MNQLPLNYREFIRELTSLDTLESSEVFRIAYKQPHPFKMIRDLQDLGIIIYSQERFTFYESVYTAYESQVIQLTCEEQYLLDLITQPMTREEILKSLESKLENSGQKSDAIKDQFNLVFERLLIYGLVVKSEGLYVQKA